MQQHSGRVTSYPLPGVEDSFRSSSHEASSSPSTTTQAPSTSSHSPSPPPPLIIHQQPDGDQLPTRIAEAPAAASPPSLQRLSVVDILGDEALQRASIVRVSPPGTPKAASLSSTPSPPHTAYPVISVPHKDLEKIHKSKNKSLWKRFLEFTPGTDAHLEKFGTRWSVGGFRTSYGGKLRQGM